MIALVLATLVLQRPPRQPPTGPPPSPAALAADTGSLRHSTRRTPPIVQAARLTSSLRIDGRLDEDAWAGAPPATEFTQRLPYDGEPATESTEVRVLYDEDAIYIGARMFDREPGGSRTQLARRDAVTEADNFQVAFDSYHDHNTAFVLGVNPSGVRTDARVNNDGNVTDNTWDPVWEAATSQDSAAWTAEMRIPLSQLRFPHQASQVWGLNFFRYVQRKAESTRLAWSRQTDRGYASYFGHLFGLEGLPQPRRLELLPYSTVREQRLNPGAPTNPFNDGSEEVASAGLDVKYGVTSNLTLDATFNPDFGQVEGDPAVVNLTAFETFFEERRPFFVEGAEIFRFGGQQIFYTRRVGRSPQVPANPRRGFVDQPTSTTILGAAKLSGRRASGWSLGILEAATAREYGTVDSLGTRFRDEVEPFTNYLVARGRRDFGRGADAVGFIVTAVNRDVQAPRLDSLRDAAYAAGVDFGHRFRRNRYNLTGSFGISHIRGDTLAIQRAQLSSARYYLRPDADYVTYDPARRSLSGWTAALSLAKEAGNWQFGLQGDATSPGFEVNDAGFQTSADDVDWFAFVNRRWTRPGRVFRSAFISTNATLNLNFGGVQTAFRHNLNLQGQFLNYWTVSTSLGLIARSQSDVLTRGGPLAASPAAWSLTGILGTDTRRKIAVSARVTYQRDELDGDLFRLTSGVTVRPTSFVVISMSPTWASGVNAQQYLVTQPDTAANATYDAQYVFSDIRQRTLDLTTRLNVTFTPSLSLQVYTQPFVATGDFFRYKELAEPRSLDYIVFGQTQGSTLTPTYNPDSTIASYSADPDGPGPMRTVRIPNRDFNARSLRGNAVLRWEYQPGSTLFLVWTTACAARSSDPRFQLSDDLRQLCQGPSDNVWAVKLSYWLSF